MTTDNAHIPDPYVATHRLAVKDVFDALPTRHKVYAHHLSKAVWKGCRIILRQTSPESEGIFDLILSLYRSCEGEWNKFVDRCDISANELQAFLGYSGMFLYNLGNFYSDGGQKFVPDLSKETLSKFVHASGLTDVEAEDLVHGMTSIPPYGLGYPSDVSLSNYYLGERIKRDEIVAIAKALDKLGIGSENTRVRKIVESDKTVFELLQASAQTESTDVPTLKLSSDAILRIVRGDHSAEMVAICDHLEKAIEYAETPEQKTTLSHYIESFQTGSLSSFRESQKVWVKDVSSSIDSILGFVESYRDPYGVRAQWEGVVCVADPEETKKMEGFVDKAGTFCGLLPWATAENDGKGPFEKSLLEIPHFSIIHGLAVCSTGVWEASNLPNYNDIREEYGSKNILIANRMSANRNSEGASQWLEPVDAALYKKNLHIIRFVATVIHELLGHGTGKLFSETEPGKFNFNADSPPFNPLTGAKVNSWYTPGETWTSKFEEIATSVEECRATLMSAYLVDNRDLLSIFGYNDHSEPTADDLIFLSYLHLGIEGIRSLEHYSTTDHTWGEAHSRGYFGIFKHLLQDGDGVLSVLYNANASQLFVRADRSKILSKGKPALGDMMCRLHIWRCTADVKSCRAFYEPLTAVEGQYQEWRQLVCSRPEPKWKFVQANTFLANDDVEIKEYEESNEGIIKSWAERGV